MSEGFPVPAHRVAEMLVALLRASGDTELSRVLEAAQPHIEVADYDNWNGGTTYHTLVLELPVVAYAAIERRAEEIEQDLGRRLGRALRNTEPNVLSSVTITPTFTEPGSTLAASDAEGARLWGTGRLRLFLSHVSAHKLAVAALKNELRIVGVSAFVAHEDIEPTLEWQSEIELALRTMDAMAALLTPEFHDSLWTDQEVGVAVGRGVLVIPIRVPNNPYGFIAKHQGLRGDLGQPATLAKRITEILLERPRTATLMRSGLLTALEDAPNFATAKVLSLRVELLAPFNPVETARIEAAIGSNGQVEGAFGVPERLRRAIARATSP
jgi:hypothetical protein